MRAGKRRGGVLRRRPTFFGRFDERGQSAAVGTILAIMVILVLLTVVTTRWIPVWVEGREAEHASIIDAQFAEFKKTIDQQALIGTPGAGVGNPFTLGQAGVPIFAPGSAGTINNGGWGAGLHPNELTFENESRLFSQTAYGALKYSTLNTRYIQQSHLYEFGGVIINQSDGQLLKAGPAIQFDNASNQTQIRLTMISLAGDGATLSGDDTVTIRTQLLFSPVITEANFTTPQVVWLNITSESAQAWQSFLNKTISNRLPAGSFQITFDAIQNSVSVRFTSVTKIVVSYQVYQSDMDLS